MIPATVFLSEMNINHVSLANELKDCSLTSGGIVNSVLRREGFFCLRCHPIKMCSQMCLAEWAALGLVEVLSHESTLNLESVVAIFLILLLSFSKYQMCLPLVAGPHWCHCFSSWWWLLSRSSLRIW